VPGETRITNALTGGQKGSKDERYDLIPVEPLAALARHYGVGAYKYADHNWRKGYDWSLSYAALQRHAQAFWGGEDLDEETGSPHLAAVAFHAFALLEWAKTHPELDDRYKGG
jgi:dATP/dGTP diphosphohydrolase